MLKELFESSFYVTFPHKGGITINLIENTYSTDFSLIDESACRDCIAVCDIDINKREQLKVRTATSVNVLSIDDLMSNVQESVGDTCDYLLDDGNKSSLIEMTCSNSKYVKNKRQKARRQLYNTLCILRANPNVRIHFDSEGAKYVIFSWKDTTPKADAADTVADSMLGMTMMSDASYSPDNISEFDYGFLLKEIRYPSPLKWNKL